MMNNLLTALRRIGTLCAKYENQIICFYEYLLPDLNRLSHNFNLPLHAQASMGMLQRKLLCSLIKGINQYGARIGSDLLLEAGVISIDLA